MSQENTINYEEIRELYREGKGLLAILKDEQYRNGYIAPDFITDIAECLNISSAEIYAVVTFYSFLSIDPPGDNIIRICGSVPCFLKNCESVIKTLEEELGIPTGKTTEDGKFSLQLVNCIGACDKAPAMLVNDKVYGNLTPDKIVQILNEYKE